MHAQEAVSDTPGKSQRDLTAIDPAFAPHRLGLMGKANRSQERQVQTQHYGLSCSRELHSMVLATGTELPAKRFAVHYEVVWFRGVVFNQAFLGKFPRVVEQRDSRS